MKKIYSILLLSSLFLISCGPTREEKVKWNDSIIVSITDVEAVTDTLIFSMGEEGFDVDKAYKKALAVTEENITKTKALDDIKEGEAFKAAALEYLEVYKKFLNNEAKKLMELSKNPEYTQEEFDAFLSSTDNRFTEADKKLTTAQKEFASKAGIELEPAK